MIDAILAAARANWLEWVAVAFGLVAVWLQTREHIANWPTAIVNVTLFTYLFWKAKLYADSVLQVYYLATSIYGWYHWLYGGAQHSHLPVTHTSRRTWVILAVVFVVVGLGLGAVESRWTDSPVPYLDATLTTASFIAQWMVTRKLLENWLIWIAANLVYVPLLVYRGLPATAVQYGVFIILAVMGYVSWKRSLVSPAPA